jgi:hypothetical protein
VVAMAQSGQWHRDSPYPGAEGFASHVGIWSEVRDDSVTVAVLGQFQMSSKAGMSASAFGGTGEGILRDPPDALTFGPAGDRALSTDCGSAVRLYNPVYRGRRAGEAQVDQDEASPERTGYR